MDNINSSKNSKTSFPQYKTLVDEYFSSDVAWNRDAYTYHTIAGRTWIKTGQRPATTYFAKIFKINIPDKFDTSRQYMLCLGIARQSTRELQANKKEGIEIAAEHAMTEPIAVMYFEKKPMRKDFLHLVNVFRDLQNQHRLVMTRDELESEKAIDAAYNDFLEEMDNYKDQNSCNKQKCENPLTEDEQKKESDVTSSKYQHMDFMDKWRKDCKNNDKASETKSKKDEKTDNKKNVKVTTSKIDDDLAAGIADALNTFSSIFGLDIPTRTKEDVEDVELTPKDMKNIEILKKLFHM